jgi:hypothetical protein
VAVAVAVAGLVGLVGLVEEMETSRQANCPVMLIAELVAGQMRFSSLEMRLESMLRSLMETQPCLRCCSGVSQRSLSWKTFQHRLVSVKVSVMRKAGISK